VVIEWGKRKKIFEVMVYWVSRTAVPPQARVLHTFLPFLGVLAAGDRHGRAKGFGNFLFLVVLARHGRATLGTGRASLSSQRAKKFSPFSHRIWTKTYKTNENNTKQTKIKQLNPWVASHKVLV